MTRRAAAAFRIAALAGLIGAPSLKAQAAGPAWRLSYAVDSAGRPLEGSKAELLAAVRGGVPVRVRWILYWRLPDGLAGGLEHVADAAFLTIHQGELFAQLAPILGQTPAPRDPVVTLRPDGRRLWYALLDTTGRLSGYFSGDSAAQTVRVPTYWYVPAPPIAPPLD